MTSAKWQNKNFQAPAPDRNIKKQADPPRHFILKLLKDKGKERILQIAGKK